MSEFNKINCLDVSTILHHAGIKRAIYDQRDNFMLGTLFVLLHNHLNDQCAEANAYETLIRQVVKAVHEAKEPCISRFSVRCKDGHYFVIQVTHGRHIAFTDRVEYDYLTPAEFETYNTVISNERHYLDGEQGLGDIGCANVNIPDSD